jgi:hypothetical protein
MKTKIKHSASGTLATTTLESKTTNIFIENKNGRHTHKRNGQEYSGKQVDCPLCLNGSEFERNFGRIGA